MNYVFGDIDDLNWDDQKIWGSKAAYLADAKKAGFPVMDGFCISIRGFNTSWRDPQFEKKAAAYFERLQKRCAAKYYIARSSAQCEDQKDHIFPGIYQSKGNISTESELIEAIHQCCNSICARTVELYQQGMNLTDVVQEYFCILVQEQLEPEYSGVLFTSTPIPEYCAIDSYYVELVKEHCYNMLQGKKHAITYELEKHDGGFYPKYVSGSDGPLGAQVEHMLEKLGTQTDQLVNRYGPSLDIEWGYRQNNIVIFQIRPVVPGPKMPARQSTPSKEIGLKANAMKKFHAMGLFPKELLISEPGEELEELEHKIRRMDCLNGPVTVRYSWNRTLGLPRYFATDREEAIKFIKKTYRAEWSVIVYQSISVKHSYELCLDSDKSILEHVPGMWETDSHIAADLWVYEKDQVTIYAVNNVRNAKYESSSGITYAAVEPYTEAELKQIALSVLPYTQTLRHNWPINCGTNFHFVQDENGSFFFLNHRELSNSPEWNSMRVPLTTIYSTEDFTSWKGGDVLLKIDLKRGEEGLLAEYIPFFKAHDCKVYVQFGILSHPAILLREMGIRVFPEYTLHKKYVFSLSNGVY